MREDVIDEYEHNLVRFSRPSPVPNRIGCAHRTRDIDSYRVTFARRHKAMNDATRARRVGSKHSDRKSMIDAPSGIVWLAHAIRRRCERGTLPMAREALRRVIGDRIRRRWTRRMRSCPKIGWIIVPDALKTISRTKKRSSATGASVTRVWWF